jgi:LacI family transcriptional regulator
VEQGAALRMRDIADRLGISVATVSRALNNRPGVGEDLRARVVKEAEVQSYVPVRHAKATGLIGFLLHRRAGPFADDPFYPAILHGVEEEAAGAGYHVLVRSTTHADELRATHMSLFSDRRVDACVVAGDDMEPQLIVDLWKSGFPIVLVNNVVEAVDVDSIETDNIGGPRAITSHLLTRHGYRDIVMLNGPLRWSTLRDRYAGYSIAMQEAGLEPRMVELPVLSAACATATMSDFLEAGNRPHAVVAANDAAALGAMRAFRAAGLRVPQDIAIAGYDDISAAALADPPLTTVRIHTVQMGREVARRLFLRLQVPPSDDLPPARTRTIVINEMVVRHSCGCTGIDGA